jgi:ketosteroid isomerase-like protein
LRRPQQSTAAACEPRGRPPGGRSKATGLSTDMHFAMVWTFREGKQVRMRMYASPGEAFEAVGLSE